MVTNGASASLAGFQVGVSLTTTNFDFSQSDGKDLRFTTGDGITPLPYWVESYSASARTAVIFVRVPQLAASTSLTLYMYYGNPTAFDASSGIGTFDMYDGFDQMRNAAAPLVTPTYEVSGQVVHPAVVRFADGWHGYEYWMAVEPYPNENDHYENPSILASNDGT